MTGKLAVVSQTGESLSFFDLSDGKRLARLDSLTSEPHELCLDPKRNLLYMSHTYRHGNYWTHGDNSHEISVVDLSSYKIVDVIDTSPAKAPHGLSIDHFNDVLYASVEELPNAEGGGVIGIDLASRQIIKQTPSQYATHWFVMTADAKRAYTSNKTASFLSVLDMENQRMVGKIDVPGCEEPGISPDGKLAYFPIPGMQFGKNPEDPKIQVIDTTTDKIVDSIQLTSGAIAVHVNTHGDLIVGQYQYGETADNEPRKMSGKIAIYDGKTRKLVGEVPVGLLPLTVKSSRDGNTAFAANVMHGTVSVIDIAQRTCTGTIVVDDTKREDKSFHVGAHGMAFYE